MNINEEFIGGIKHPLIIFYEEHEGEWLSLWERNPNKTYTDVFSSSDIMYTTTSVSFISEIPNEINYIAGFKKGSMVATRKARISFDIVIKLDVPLTLDFIVQNESKSMVERMKSVFNSKNKIFYLDKYQLRTIVSSLSKINDNYITQMKRIIFRDRKMNINNRNLITSCERDALGLIFRINNMDQEINAVSQWNLEDLSTPAFMQNLESINVREDMLIFKDFVSFDNWHIINNATHGICTLSNGVNYISIVYANRTRIESNIGVDLIYFDHVNRSYIFVQYKRLSDENGKYIYRPTSDKSLAKELNLMEKLESNLSKDRSDYRINDEVFYFKFCKERQEVYTKDLSAGFYMPKDYFLLVNEIQKNKNNSISISYDTVTKYLTNTVFIELIKSGLIGTRIDDVSLVTNIIEESLSGKKSLILVATAPQ